MKKYFISLLIIILMFFTIIAQANILSVKRFRSDLYNEKTVTIPDIEYSTYFGGINFEWTMAIAVDSKGCSYFTGVTRSFTLPTKNAYDKSYNLQGDAFITKLSPSGEKLEYSTFIGGNKLDYGIMIDVDE